ncbi:MAG: hypothetical protein OXR68_04205 [Alphaproteobacteria bacterium]|nr:hypothetical protein [Alphaproteobacteria bacterium]MDD9919810.1 hypothetical protein [Alphaproteobacteria bacterium]
MEQLEKARKVVVDRQSLSLLFEYLTLLVKSSGDKSLDIGAIKINRKNIQIESKRIRRITTKFGRILWEPGLEPPDTMIFRGSQSVLILIEKGNGSYQVRMVGRTDNKYLQKIWGDEFLNILNLH